MKTLVCIHLLNNYTGSPKVLADVVIAARKRGLRVVIHTSAGGEGFLTGLDAEYRYFRYGWSKNKLSTLVSYSASQVRLFFDLLRYRREDAVFYVNTVLPFAGAVAGRLMGKRVVCHIHEVAMRNRGLWAFLRFVAARTSSVMVYVSRYMERAGGFANVPGVCLYNCLPDAFLAQGARSPYAPVREGAFTVLLVASLRDYKGIPEFLELGAACEDDPRIRFSLLVSADAEGIRRYFSGKRVPGNLTIHPQTADTPAFYAKASLLVNLSRTKTMIESFGLTILEAMAFGVPVIAPPLGGPVELVEDGEQGYLICSEEMPRLIEKVRALSRDEALCRALSGAGRAKAAKFNQAAFEAGLMGIIHG